MTDPAPTSGRLANGRFGPGNSGRPPGARNRVSRQLLLEIHKDFEAHKAELLDRLRSTYTPSYFSTLAKLMPHMDQTEGEGFADYSDEEAGRLFRSLRDMFAVTTEPRIALAEMEIILASESAGEG